MSTLIFLILFGAAASQVRAQAADKTRETITTALSNGDTKTFNAFLNELCDLDLPGYKGTYSKAQAGKMLSVFFEEHPVSGLKIIREGTLGKSEQYLLTEMKSGTATWRIYCVLKERDGQKVIPLVRIYQ